MEKHHSLRKSLLKHWQLYLFLAIPVAYILIFAYYPMLGLQIAFKKFTPSGGIWGSQWIGFDHFVNFFTSYQFERVIKNTLYLSFYNIIAGFPIPIMLALAINAMRGTRYKKIVQTTLYIPHFISVVVLVGMVFQIFNARVGLYGSLSFLFTGAYPTDILGRTAAYPHLYVWSGVWQGMGYGAIIYLAALSGISPELHEAAEIDGANRFKRLLHIDLPGIMPTVIILLIMRAGQIMSVGFEKVFLFQKTLNLSSMEVISTYVYRVSIFGATGDFSYGTAVGLFNSVVNFTMLCAVNALSRRYSESSLW